MPTTNITPLRDMRGCIEYITQGKGKQRQQHIADGTTREVAVVSDFTDGWAFLAQCESMTQGRKVKGYEVRVSWPTDELNPSDSNDLAKAAQYGYELVERLFPGCPHHVVVHTDGEGGCVHVHAETANAVYEGRGVNAGREGKAIKDNRHARHVAAASDQLAREWGFGVVEHTKRPEWLVRRAEIERRLEDGPTERVERSLRTELAIGDAVAEVFADEWETVDEFKAALDQRRITLREQEKNGVTGWTYSMHLQLEGEDKGRVRRAKASKLSAEFTAEGVAQEADLRRRSKHKEEGTLDKGKDEIGPLRNQETPENSGVDAISTLAALAQARRDEEEKEEEEEGSGAAVTAGHVDRHGSVSDFPKPWTVQLSEKVLDKRIDEKTRELSRWRAFLATVRGVFEGIAGLVAGAPRCDREAKQAAADALAEGLHEREDWALR